VDVGCGSRLLENASADGPPLLLVWMEHPMAQCLAYLSCACSYVAGEPAGKAFT
jgi:hypothetical protein